MKSIKPGRGPSMMNGIGSIAAGIFGIIWTIVVLASGAPPFFALFGIVFILLALIQAGYHIKNATGRNRFSSFDITDEQEESDPFANRFENSQSKQTSESENIKSRFCPYCGAKAEEEYQFCNQCGKKLPE